jgi:hemolysin D
MDTSTTHTQLRRSHFKLTFGLWSFLLAMIVAATVGRVDIAAKAVGRVAPDGQVKSVQTFEAGTIAEILVREGEVVQAGALLVRLDTSDAAADMQRLTIEMAVARVEYARLKATVAFETGAVFDPPADSPPNLRDASAQFMRSQIDQILTTVSGIDANILEKEAAIVSAQALLDKNRELLPILQERESARSMLLKKEAVSRLTYLDDKERLVNLEGDLRVQEAKLLELNGGLASLRENRRNVVARFLADRGAELVEAQRKVLSLEQDLAKAREKHKRHFITAPIDGTVQDLTVYTLGGVTRMGERLMTIVPVESKLVIDALVSNRDIGLVEVGQEAEIRVTAFDYRRYGTVRGRLINVARDAMSQDQLNQLGLGKSTTERAADTRSSGPPFDGPHFRVQLALDAITIDVDGETEKLTAGMTVEANVLVGRRRIIDFFLEAIQSYRQDAFRQD